MAVYFVCLFWIVLFLEVEYAPVHSLTHINFLAGERKFIRASGYSCHVAYGLSHFLDVSFYSYLFILRFFLLSSRASRRGGRLFALLAFRTIRALSLRLFASPWLLLRRKAKARSLTLLYHIWDIFGLFRVVALATNY